jgi:hypothetical protein
MRRRSSIIMDFRLRFNRAYGKNMRASAWIDSWIDGRVEMSEEESKAFVIRDRRGHGEDKEKVQASAAPTPSSAPPRPAPQDGATPQTTAGHEGAMPVTFSGFIFSLSTSAMMLMGEQLDPQQGQMPVNLAQAKEIIDILSMLESKTRGNLATDEQAVLTDMLYALRMKYVDAASGSHSPHSS